MSKTNEFDFRKGYWEKLEEAVGGKEGAELCEGMRELYGLWSSEMIDWFAGLYDPTVGGYYYSNCARDNSHIVYKGNVYPLMPDLESTAQALRFISQSGLAGKPFSSSFADALPEWMKEKIRRYVKGSQHENGFFYNPQWPTEYTDMKLSRRARDTGNSVSVLYALGSNPTYDTPTGEKGDYLDIDGNPVTRPHTNATSDGEKAMKTTEDGVAIPPHLENRETLLHYLNCDLDIKTQAYPAGNTLTAQMRQIIYRDEVLKREGADYSLVDTLMDWLDENQNPENGLWHPVSNYYGVNGLMKITGCYGKVGRLLPNADKAVRSALDAISTDECAGAVTSIYNSWFAVERVKRHLRTYGGEEGNAIADKILAELRANAKPWLIKTREKFEIFKKPYGSFSYTPKASSARSQGCPVAFDGIYEGDINATIIASSELLFYIYSALELRDFAVPMFGEAHLARYRELLTEAHLKAGGSL